MGRDFVDKSVKELKLIAIYSGMNGYSGLRKAELIRKLKEHLYIKCHSCGYNVIHLWIEWVFDYYDLYKPYSYSQPGFNCPNCGIKYFNYN